MPGSTKRVPRPQSEPSDALPCQAAESAGCQEVSSLPTLYAAVGMGTLTVWVPCRQVTTMATAPPLTVTVAAGCLPATERS